MKILVDRIELERLLDEITYNQSNGITKTREGLQRIPDKNHREEWVVIEPRPVVNMDTTKTGFDKYSVTGTFNIINCFSCEEDAMEEVNAARNYANLVIIRAMDVHKLVSRKQLAELRELVFELELLSITPEASDKLRKAHQLIYEMQNSRENNENIS